MNFMKKLVNLMIVYSKKNLKKLKNYFFSICFFIISGLNYLI